MDTQQSGIPAEIVAAITAAISSYLDQPMGDFVVTSIQAEPGRGLTAAPASGWAKVGVLEAHLARRQFGIRTR